MEIELLISGSIRGEWTGHQTQECRWSRWSSRRRRESDDSGCWQNI